MKERKPNYTLDDLKADLLAYAQEVVITLSYNSPKVTFRETIAAGAMLNNLYRDLMKQEPEDEGDAGSSVRKYATAHQPASAKRGKNARRADGDTPKYSVVDTSEPDDGDPDRAH